MQVLLEVPRSDYVWKLLEDLSRRPERFLPKDIPGLPWLPSWADCATPPNPPAEGYDGLDEARVPAQIGNLNCQHQQLPSRARHASFRHIPAGGGHGLNKAGPANVDDLNRQHCQHGSTIVPKGTFVATHGLQTLSNTVWALATLDMMDVKGLDIVARACIEAFCQVPAEALHPQVRVFLRAHEPRPILLICNNETEEYALLCATKVQLTEALLTIELHRYTICGERT
jgi:hypothetical protein